MMDIPPDPRQLFTQAAATTTPDATTQPDPLRQYATWVTFILAFYLVGPVLSCAKVIQAESAGAPWQADKRWANTYGGAFASLLWYLPILAFHGPLSAFWTTIFTTLAHTLHLPFLVWFGGTTLLPPVPQSTLLRWMLALPCMGLLALAREAVHPLTTWESKRIITPQEQQEQEALAAAAEKKRLAAEHRKAAQAAVPPAAGTASKKTPATRSPRTSTKRKKAADTLIPKADSLWGQIDWKSVPENHPLKREIRKEAERLDDERREQARNQWLAEQQAQRRMISSPQIVDAAPAQPVPPAAPTNGNTYNWDEGEGSIEA